MLAATLQRDPLAQQSATVRIESIDLLRGIVMIIMALDHVRDYFHADAYIFDPLRLADTTAPIFFTRWITHFCAPVFVFLAGTSAFFVGQKKGLRQLSIFLLTRGIWLVFLEISVVGFGWFFNIEFSVIVLQVIWALGIGMIILAALVHLPIAINFALGILLVAGHNLLDGIHVEGTGAATIGWAMLHEFAAFPLNDRVLLVGYPIIPWTGIMVLGYCFGTWYQPGVSALVRRKRLLMTGTIMLLSFIVVRYVNVYGDPRPWSEKSSSVFTFLSFINVNKYPPSLLYVLITLGPSMIVLALTENIRGTIQTYTTALGRVPLFFYVIHLYAIHLVAVIAAMLTGFDASDMVLNTWVTDAPQLKGYGFSLGAVYVIWIAFVLLLLPVCLWYDRYKRTNRDKWWLSYL
ncbi:MAG TPA: heparan-alpha-glucosaminide N-acetyltransferase domain-containing protein [Chryseosolibacter sp.]|nr:heparan-alpha-glucosaminide N-acetyltransferase domain-containing protein [Chryseosolibacter sp.]